jgi:hypothetical protein
VQTEEDLIAEDLAKRVENRLPGAERERDDGVKVSFAELADLNRCSVMVGRAAGWADANRASVAAMAFPRKPRAYQPRLHERPLT